MQGSREEIAPPQDDMAEGDLGDGTGSSRPIQQTPPTVQRSRSFTAPKENSPPWTEPLKHGGRTSDAGSAWTLFTEPHASFRRAPVSLALSDLSKEELLEKLEEANEAAEVLRCELDVMHRYLEGKYEALKILQGKAILEKATTHTKSQLQKTEERAKVLEKEVNGLQWEITFNQVQLKKLEQSWEEKLNRISNENKALSSGLEKRVREVHELRTENAVLGQQCLELLSMLNIKEKRAYQGTKPSCSHGREGTVLELAVLGACQCPGVMDACPCAKISATTRTQLLQLKQELDVQCRRREEALMVADSFRIAFEEQLRKRSENFLLVAEAHALKSRLRSPDGVNRSSPISVAQKLRSILSSSVEAKTCDKSETLHRLLDLLNDKDEALAHQRKVSLMLARHAEELESQLNWETKFPPKFLETPLSEDRLTELSDTQQRRGSLELLSEHLSETETPPQGLPCVGRGNSQEQ